jgi:uncharacterized protein (DUF305 family)
MKILPMLLVAMLPLSAVAQPMDHMAGMTNTPTTAFSGAMERMHQAMAVPPTGDVDRDFVAGMIPHHQGAVDMARIELAQGHDPAMHKLARQIIAAQEREIAFMRQWQAHHGGAPK